MSWSNGWVGCAGAALLLAAACGDDEGTPASSETVQGAAADGQIGTSDPDARLDEINDAEWKAACADINEAGSTPRLAHGPCIMLGLLSKVTGTDCMSTYELCIGEPGDLECDEKPADCSATLRELDACQMSSLEWLASETEDLSCDDSLSALIEIPEHITPECQALMEKCPSIEPPGQSTDEEW